MKAFEASNVIRKNQNDYTYDALNRLKTSYEYGWFQKQPKDIAPDYGEVNRDYTGTAPVNYSIKAVESKDYTVVFDAASKSLACDLLITSSFFIFNISTHAFLGVPQNKTTIIDGGFISL